MRSIAWLDDRRVIVTNFKGTCSIYSPNISFDEETNYHKIVECASFQNLNCLNFAALPIRLVSDAFGGVSKLCFVERHFVGFLKLLLANLEQKTRACRDAVEEHGHFFKEEVPVFYCETRRENEVDLVSLFVDSWGQFNKEKQVDTELCLDVSRLVETFSEQEIIKRILDAETISVDKNSILQIFRIFAKLSNANE